MSTLKADDESSGAIATPSVFSITRRATRRKPFKRERERERVSWVCLPFQGEREGNKGPNDKDKAFAFDKTLD